MNDLAILTGKKILIVDDEPDVLDTLIEILDMCLVDAAPDFETAKKFLNKNMYDVAIFDIMGVQGYDLLEISVQKDIPALMFTAHALNADDPQRKNVGYRKLCGRFNSLTAGRETKARALVRQTQIFF